MQSYSTMVEIFEVSDFQLDRLILGVTNSKGNSA